MTVAGCDGPTRGRIAADTGPGGGGFARSPAGGGGVPGAAAGAGGAGWGPSGDCGAADGHREPDHADEGEEKRIAPSVAGAPTTCTV